eukprot:TRINITY_DN26890_c0_g3_i1.p1 TRINITY_DN26890_c0_g3~~TRINITY_DN26890_c0_g3_i1.p1  ORF type:complete len:738 (+),score=160.27 TRINITY_DN26890_c0_g3_i1:20-2233(+)
MAMVLDERSRLGEPRQIQGDPKHMSFADFGALKDSEEQQALQLVLAIVPSLCGDAILALVRCCWRRLSQDRRQLFSADVFGDAPVSPSNLTPDTPRKTFLERCEPQFEPRDRGSREVPAEGAFAVAAAAPQPAPATAPATTATATAAAAPAADVRGRARTPRHGGDSAKRGASVPRGADVGVPARKTQRSVTPPKAVSAPAATVAAFAAAPAPEAVRAVRRQPGRLAIDIACARGNAAALEVLAEEDGSLQVSGHVEGDIVWVVRSEDMAKRMLTLRDDQWLSHIPGVLRACCKATLSEALKAREAKFWPRTWSYPDVSAEEICREATAEGGMPLIVKPSSGAHGSGIFLALDRVDLGLALKKLPKQQSAIVQQYIDPPLLLEGHKWDIRLYAVLLPDKNGEVAAYMATEGLVRVSVDRYQRPDPTNVYRTKMHLSNYSISKFYDKFDFGDSADEATRGGSKRLLSEVLSKLEDESKLVAAGTLRALRRLVRRTVRAMEIPMREYFHCPESFGGSSETAELARSRLPQCFQIVGLDVMLDEKAHPWLLEVNNNPSLSIDEIRPLCGNPTNAQVNQLFASARSERQSAVLSKIEAREASRGRGSVTSDTAPVSARGASAQRAKDATLTPRHRSSTQGNLGAGGGDTSGTKARASTGCLASTDNATLCSVAVPDGSRPCRCSAHHRAHTHHRCPVDVAVKLPVLRGTLDILRAAMVSDTSARSKADMALWAEGTSLELV